MHIQVSPSNSITNSTSGRVSTGLRHDCNHFPSCPELNVVHFQTVYTIEICIYIYMLLSTSGWWRIGYAVYIHCIIWWCSTTEICGMIPSDFPNPLTPGRGSTVRRWPRWPMEAPWVVVVYPKVIAAIGIGKWMIHRLLYSGSLFSDKPMWVWVQTLIVWHLHFSASYNTTAEPAWAFWMYMWSLDFCIWVASVCSDPDFLRNGHLLVFDGFVFFLFYCAALGCHWQDQRGRHALPHICCCWPWHGLGSPACAFVPAGCSPCASSLWDGSCCLYCFSSSTFLCCVWMWCSASRSSELSSGNGRCGRLQVCMHANGLAASKLVADASCLLKDKTDKIPDEQLLSLFSDRAPAFAAAKLSLGKYQTLLKSPLFEAWRRKDSWRLARAREAFAFAFCCFAFLGGSVSGIFFGGQLVVR